jgi:hypothetical protein
MTSSFGYLFYSVEQTVAPKIAIFILANI